MMRSLWSAASGMKGQQKQMDIVAHNLANVNTTGAKAQRAEFQDLLYQTLRAGGAESGDGNMYPTPMQIGLGSRLSATNRIFVQGNVQTTDNPTDLCIQGEGFFQIQMPDGTTGYTRDGSFKIDANRNLVTSDGYPLTEGITFPENATLDSVVVSPTGAVSCEVDGQPQDVGQIELARFLNPAGLTAVGKNLFVESAASGEPQVNQPGNDGTGTLLQSCLEMSNVDMASELTDMIVTQRGYQSNSKIITVSDELLETLINMKR